MTESYSCLIVFAVRGHPPITVERVTEFVARDGCLHLHDGDKHMGSYPLVNVLWYQRKDRK